MKLDISFQVDLKNQLQVKAFNQVIDILSKSGMSSEKQDVPQVISPPATVEFPLKQEENDQIKKLIEFQQMLSDKQKEVFEYFLDNPGHQYGDELRESLSILNAHGAISGVFSATKRWEKNLKANPNDCPFSRISWSDQKNCGIYRGILTEEAEQIKKIRSEDE